MPIALPCRSGEFDVAQSDLIMIAVAALRARVAAGCVRLCGVGDEVVVRRSARSG